MLRYFLATDDQVLGSLSDRMSLFFRRPDRVKMCYTRKFGKFRSSGNQKKEGCICLLPVLRTPACSLTIVPSYRYLGSVKKKERVRTDTKCRFTDRHRKEIGSSVLTESEESYIRP